MTKAKPKTAKATIAKVAPGPLTRAAIERARVKHDALPRRPFMAVEKDEDGKSEMAPTHSDDVGHSAWLHASLGTTSTSFLMQQLYSLQLATGGTATAGEPDVAGMNANLALLGAIDPKDELEGALATQMVGCHALSMAMLCRAKTTTRVDQLQLYGNLAVKLQRTFTAQIEALARMRGKGQQTVRVEHVTVQPGAQAIVGDVHHHAPGGPGILPKTEERPHEQSAAAASAQGRPALPSPDPTRNGVPIPGDAKRAVSNPRRAVARRAARKPERAEARSLEPRDDRASPRHSGDEA
nr:hypothetical protein [Sphingomonas sp. Leaf33]